MSSAPPETCACGRWIKRVTTRDGEVIADHAPTLVSGHYLDHDEPMVVVMGERAAVREVGPASPIYVHRIHQCNKARRT